MLGVEMWGMLGTCMRHVSDTLVMVAGIVSDGVGDVGGGGGGDFSGVLSGESGKIGNSCWGEAESVSIVRMSRSMLVLSSMLVNLLSVFIDLVV